MKIEEISEFARKKGFFWPASEIYGGFTGFYDYGPNGALLKRKLENLWRRFFLSLGESFFEIETADIMPEKVFQASGHITNFVDPVARCKKCGTHHRADHILEEMLGKNFEGIRPEELTALVKQHKIGCPKCKGELGGVEVLNMMFPLEVGAGKGTAAFLRPETAQGAYVNFLRCFKIMRSRLPLGLVIVGKAYRNEISPRNLLIRMREFTQAELQIFFDPDNIDKHERWSEVKDYKLVFMPAAEKKVVEIDCEEANKKYRLPKFYLWHLAKSQQFFLEILKIRKEDFRIRELSAEERAFYNKIHCDLELRLESLTGFKEVGGVHYRTAHDLSGHEKVSGVSQKIFFGNKKFVPHVLELSFGIDRIVYSLIELFYKKEKDRAVLALAPQLSPIQVAVFPLVKKDRLDEAAKKVYAQLRKEFDAVYDEQGSIGKRYYREDERGTPFCITIDYDTLADGTATVRNRDTTKQERVKIEELANYLRKALKA